MSQLVLNRGSSYRRQLVRKYLSHLHIGPYLLIFSLIFIVALITIITLVFSARQVTKGYTLNSLEASHQELVKENENKDMQISKVKSLNYIEGSDKVKSMVKQNQIVFVSGSNTIAKR